MKQSNLGRQEPRDVVSGSNRAPRPSLVFAMGGHTVKADDARARQVNGYVPSKQAHTAVLGSFAALPCGSTGCCGRTGLLSARDHDTLLKP